MGEKFTKSQVLSEVNQAHDHVRAALAHLQEARRRALDAFGREVPHEFRNYAEEELAALEFTLERAVRNGPATFPAALAAVEES